MKFKNISIRENIINFADRLVDSIVQNRKAHIDHNRVITFRYTKSGKLGPEKFLRTQGYLGKFLEKQSGVKVVSVTSGLLPKISIFLPDTINEPLFYSELIAFFNREIVKQDIGEVSVRVQDLTGEDYLVTQSKAAFFKHLEDLKRLVEKYEIEEESKRPSTPLEKACLLKIIENMCKYYIAHPEKAKEFIVLIAGIEDLLNLKQDIISILAFIIITRKLSKDEARRFLEDTEILRVVNPENVFKFIEIKNKLKQIDEHLLARDKKDNTKANRLKMYLIWRSYEITRKAISGFWGSPPKKTIRRIAFRALILDMVDRLAQVGLVEDDNERDEMANRIYYVDALISRDLNMEGFQIRQRSTAFAITHPEQVILIEEEMRKRMGGRTRQELEKGISDLAGVFEFELIGSLVHRLETEIDVFFEGINKTQFKAQYWAIISDFARTYYFNQDSISVAQIYKEFGTSLRRVGGLVNREIQDLLKEINLFLENHKLPEVQFRLKTLHSIYEKAKRIKYDKLKREYEEDARRQTRKGLQYQPFSLTFDDIEIESEDIRQAIEFNYTGEDEDIKAQYAKTKDDKIFDIAGFRIIYEYPEERQNAIPFLSELGPILATDLIDNSRGYKAIHIKMYEEVFVKTIIEVQIRDREAHIKAEEGDAQHRFYKGGENLPAIAPLSTYSLDLDRMSRLKFVPVEVHRYTARDKLESISRDFVILEKDGNGYDLLVLGGYFRSCINESEVKADDGKVTAVKLKAGFVKTFDDKLLKKTNTLRSKLKIKIDMAQEANMRGFSERLAAIKQEYEPFIDKLNALVIDYYLEDLDMLFGGMIVDSSFKDDVDNYLNIKPDIKITRIRKVISKERRDAEISTKITMVVPNRIGLVSFWSRTLESMGFNQVEKCRCIEIEDNKYEINFQFKGALSDDESSVIKALLERATDFYKATSQKPEKAHSLEMEIDIENGIGNIALLADIFKVRGINIIQLESKAMSKNGKTITIFVRLNIPEKQAGRTSSLLADIALQKYIKKVETIRK